MFTDKAQFIIDLSKDHAFSRGSVELTLEAMLAAVAGQAEAGVLLCECTGMERSKLKSLFPELPELMSCPTKLPLSEAVRILLNTAKTLADEVPDRSHPGLIDIRHMVCAMAVTKEACAILKTTPVPREKAKGVLSRWYDRDVEAPGLEELSDRLRALRSALLKRVFGQDHAIHAFIEGLFNAEVVAASDVKRRTPRAIFVFAGPPGVGKTFLAELGASYLERPFKRFDMSAYSGHYQNEQLVGMAKSYSGAHPGILTEFVEKNPASVLLFDEIEKAHQTTIHLFLQILDAGLLEDKYNERNVFFKDTTIIFTTNAGKKLYDRPSISGLHGANAGFHRKTILDALENERDSLTGQPIFPAAVCSRLSTGYPILFNHLGVNELEKVAFTELGRMADLFEIQYFKRITYDDLVPMCLVLREGSRVDARTIRSQTEMFVKTEIFKFCQLYKTDRLEDVLKRVDLIHFGPDKDKEEWDPETAALFQPRDRFRILLVTREDLTHLYSKHLEGFDWIATASPQEAMEHLANREVDMVLLDLWMGEAGAPGTQTIRHFDHIPAASRRVQQGQELLRKIHERLPAMPIYLLSFTGKGEGIPDKGTVDEELFMACMRTGGARGVIHTDFTSDKTEGWESRRDLFRENLSGTVLRLYRQKSAERMGQERKVLYFDTAPTIDEKSRKIPIRFRNFRLGRAVSAEDVGTVLDDVERPATLFKDVIGAQAAKEELQFFIEHLKNPRRFAAMGLKAPKGVLLYGPPGTGKTMLARAMAGESNVAFIAASASNFVTIWQGSGPQNVRDLFERARRYAPSIVFIDEIDAIGKERTGAVGGGADASENTLNALLTEMDGFTSPSPDRPVFILAATNYALESEGAAGKGMARALDPALVRRFSRTIYIDLPDKAARLQYLSMRLAKRPACKVTKEGIQLIAERSSGMTIANLELVIETAARKSAKDNKDFDNRMLEDAFETVSFGEKKVWNPEDVERTARHEAGHTLMYWLSGKWPSYVTIVSRGKFGGYMARSSDELEKQFGYTRDQLLANIRVSLGGRGAEIVYYGKEGGLTTGVSSDLEHAAQIARSMIGRYGMDDELGVMVVPDVIEHRGASNNELSDRLNEKAKNILNEEMTRTLGLLKTHRKELDVVSEALAREERLSAEDLKKILPEAPAVSAPGLAAHPAGKASRSSEGSAKKKSAPRKK